MSSFVPNNNARRIICAALRRKSDQLVITSPRHFDITARHLILELPGGRDSWLGCDQGFVDQYNTFHTREDAWIIAKDNGQIIRTFGYNQSCLYSENLY